jgi:hypothetical protein
MLLKDAIFSFHKTCKRLNNYYLSNVLISEALEVLDSKIYPSILTRQSTKYFKNLLRLIILFNLQGRLSLLEFTWMREVAIEQMDEFN